MNVVIYGYSFTFDFFILFIFVFLLQAKESPRTNYTQNNQNAQNSGSSSSSILPHAIHGVSGNKNENDHEMKSSKNLQQISQKKNQNDDNHSNSEQDENNNQVSFFILSFLFYFSPCPVLIFFNFTPTRAITLCAAHTLNFSISPTQKLSHCPPPQSHTHALPYLTPTLSFSLGEGPLLEG